MHWSKDMFFSVFGQILKKNSLLGCIAVSFVYGQRRKQNFCVGSRVRAGTAVFITKYLQVFVDLGKMCVCVCICSFRLNVNKADYIRLWFC